MSTEIDYINYVVIGIGINTNIEQFPEELKQTATSLRIEAGHSIRRSHSLQQLCGGLKKHMPNS